MIDINKPEVLIVDNDERFLRQEIDKAIKNHSIKYVREINPSDRAVIVDAGIKHWRCGGVNSVQMLEYAIQYAKANYKRTY
ncbi:MAG: hypothetical protein PF495_11975 [Spirochaetales bacterium]|jgi:hypothetical protein|nr:hypothetical protein [Spirochaetales bacterium]